MTPAPPLPDLLAALAQRVPERVLWSDGDSARIRVGGQLIYLDLLDPAQCGPWLEYALREECDEREWEWELEGKAGKAVATVWNGAGGAEYCHLGITPSPAHALACAMVAALGGEGEG